MNAPPPRAWPPLPSWIDPALELTDTADRATTPADFVHDSVAALVALGCPRERAVEVVAHCATECSWGRRAVGHNCGGVKLSLTDARNARLYGAPLRWFRAPGHVASGDEAVVYYRAFADDAAFYGFWLARYAPRSPELAQRDRYIATGRAFWGGGDWFVAMLLAGYRGPVRQAEIEELIAAGRDPAEHPSVAEHCRLVDRVRALAGAP